MCAVSVIMDHFQDKWNKEWVKTFVKPSIPFQVQEPPLTNEEIRKFREQVKELEELLRKFKEYDTRTGQPNCESDSKKEAIQKIADTFHIKINFPPDC